MRYFFFFKMTSEHGTVRDPKVSDFFQQKTLEKWDTLGKFSQKGPFFDYNKPKDEKRGTLWGETHWGAYSAWYLEIANFKLAFGNRPFEICLQKSVLESRFKIIKHEKIIPKYNQTIGNP